MCEPADPNCETRPATDAELKSLRQIAVDGQDVIPRRLDRTGEEPTDSSCGCLLGCGGLLFGMFTLAVLILTGEPFDEPYLLPGAALTLGVGAIAIEMYRFKRDSDRAWRPIHDARKARAKELLERRVVEVVRFRPTEVYRVWIPIKRGGHIWIYQAGRGRGVSVLAREDEGPGAAAEIEVVLMPYSAAAVDDRGVAFREIGELDLIDELIGYQDHEGRGYFALETGLWERLQAAHPEIDDFETWAKGDSEADV